MGNLTGGQEGDEDEDGEQRQREEEDWQKSMLGAPLDLDGEGCAAVPTAGRDGGRWPSLGSDAIPPTAGPEDGGWPSRADDEDLMPIPVTLPPQAAFSFEDDFLRQSRASEAWQPSPQRCWQSSRGPTQARGASREHAPAGTTELSAEYLYLRDILACEASLQAAFEPVLRVSCYSHSDNVDRSAFAQAVTRIWQHFAPHSVPPSLPLASWPPFTQVEALEHFREALLHLAAGLSDSSEGRRQQQQQQLGRASPLGLGGGVAGGGAAAAAAQFASSFGAPRPASASPCEASPVQQATASRMFETQRPRPVALSCLSPGSPLEVPSAGPCQSPTPMAGRPYQTLQAASPEKPSTMRSFFASAGRAGEGGGSPGPELGPLVPKMFDTPPTSMLFASLTSPSKDEAGVSRPAAIEEDDDEEQELLAQVEASRGRAKDLQQALAEEEARIRHQAEEELRLRMLHERLLRELPPQQLEPAGASSNPGVAEASLAPQEGPRSLADLRDNLKSVKQLRRRVKELEAALDSREEHVIALTDQLQSSPPPTSTSPISASPFPAAVRVV